MSNFVGQQFGNYRLIRLLGRGGFADVYLGEHVYLGTQAAVKVLRTQPTDESLEKFLSEARTIVRLEHPHIVRVLECSIEDEIPFLVMNYAPGGTLRQRYPSGTRLKSEELLLYIKQVASALQYAHDRKLIHRDVKPENMLLGQNNKVLLSDFGLALVSPSTTESQAMKEAAGTVPYMAPEQFEGRPRTASDQYALGIVAYEWLSGECPFQGSLSEIVSQHMATPPPPLCDRCSDLSSSVERVIFTALAKEPEQRFPSVQAFGAALEQAYHGKAKKWYRAIQLPASEPSASQLAPASHRGLRWSSIALRCLMLGTLIALFPFMLIPNFPKVIRLSAVSPVAVPSTVASSAPTTVTQAKIPVSTVMPSPTPTQERAVQPTPILTSAPTTNPTAEPTADYSVREINNNDPGISYTSGCYYKNGLSSALYNNDVEVCTQQNDAFTYTFTGKSIYLVTAYSQKQTSTISCYIDGNFTQSFDLRPSDNSDSSGFTYGVELPIGVNLAYGQHTASCKKTSASGKYFVIDALIINK